MDSGSTSQFARLLPRGPVGACVCLAALVVVVFPLVAWVSWGRSGQDGVLAAGVAAGVCLVASMAALWVTHAFAGTPQAIAGALGSILLRTAVPLGVTFVLVSASPVLAKAGLFGLTVVFYLLTLAGETLLAVRLVSLACRRPAVAPVDSPAGIGRVS